MVCVNCGLRRNQHQYQRDGGSGSGPPKRGLTKKYCSMYVRYLVETKQGNYHK